MVRDTERSVIVPSWTSGEKNKRFEFSLVRIVDDLFFVEIELDWFSGVKLDNDSILDSLFIIVTLLEIS